jgi:hypothetical protein
MPTPNPAKLSLLEKKNVDGKELEDGGKRF